MLAASRGGTAKHLRRVSLCRMSDDEKEDGERHKKVTAATSDAPAEEFISPTNQPTRTENESAPEPDRPERKTEE